MSTIRFLTPSDYADMCDIINKHTSPAGAFCNERGAPARPNFKKLAKEHVEECFNHNMSNFWGYFDDSGELVAWVLFVRWLDNSNVTIRQLIEDPKLSTPRPSGAENWSSQAIELVNFGIQWFWAEGIETFWSRLYTGRESLHFSKHPDCLLKDFEAVKVCDVPAYNVPPEQYLRVSWSALGDETMIYRFNDPVPLVKYSESANDQTGNAEQNWRGRAPVLRSAHIEAVRRERLSRG